MLTVAIEDTLYGIIARYITDGHEYAAVCALSDDMDEIIGDVVLLGCEENADHDLELWELDDAEFVTAEQGWQFVCSHTPA